MKQKSLLLALFLVTTTVHGQIKFAPEVGLNLAFRNERITNAGISKTQISNLSPGFKAGLLVDVKVTDHFYIQPGAFYTWDNVKFTQEVDYSKFGMGNLSATKRYTISYIQIPVYAVYKSNLESMGRFLCGIGPYIGYVLGAYQKTKSPLLDSSSTPTSYNWEKEEFELRLGNNVNADQLKRVDYGINAMIGYESNVGLYFRGSYSYGFANLAPGSPDHTFTRNWGIGITMGVLLGKDNW